MTNTEMIESLKALLYDAEIKYSWEQKGSVVISRYGHLISWGISIFLSYSIFSFFWFVLDGFTVDTPEFWAMFVFMTMMMLVSRYLYFPDKHRCYHLTSLGIHYTEQDMIPEVAYKIVRGFAWVGIAVCIIAVFVLGPLAFVGAGAFALMAFGMTNFQPTVDDCYVLIDERSFVFNVIDDVVLSLSIPGKDGFEYVGNIFTMTLEQKTELLAQLKLFFPEIEVIEIKRLNEKYKHPIYQRDEEVVK